MTKCVSCRRKIDDAARLCPYCGADPETGEKLDTQAILQEVFKPRRLSTTENVMEYARQRQGVVIAIAGVVAFLILAGLHQFVTRRNAREVSEAVPLTELTDLSNQPAENNRALPMPALNFQYEGRPQAMRTFFVEPGATTPPEVLAAQQAAQPQPVPAAGQPAAPGAPAPAPPAQPAPQRR